VLSRLALFARYEAVMEVEIRVLRHAVDLAADPLFEGSVS
jgi:hypothetical protein